MTTDAHAAGDLDEPLADGAGHAVFQHNPPEAHLAAEVASDGRPAR